MVSGGVGSIVGGNIRNHTIYVFDEGHNSVVSDVGVKVECKSDVHNESQNSVMAEI